MKRDCTSFRHQPCQIVHSSSQPCPPGANAGEQSRHLFILLVARIPQRTPPSLTLFTTTIFCSPSAGSVVPHSPTAPHSLLTNTQFIWRRSTHPSSPHNRFRRAFQALSSRRSSHLPAFLTSLSPTHSPTSPVPTLHSPSAVFATRYASQQPWATTTTHTAASSAA